MDWKYSEKKQNPRKFQKAKLEFDICLKYLQSIYIVLCIINMINLEII